MEPQVKKIFSKLPKTELATEKVELSLQQANKLISKAKNAARFRDGVETRIKEAKENLSRAVKNAKESLKEIDDDQLALMRAGSDIDKLKKDMQEAGITTAPLDARKEEIKDAYNLLSKVSSDINRIVITATNI